MSSASSAASAASDRLYRSLPPIPEYEYFGGDEDHEDHLAQASHSDLAFEWSMLCQECTDCWTGNGKTKSVLPVVHTLGKQDLMERERYPNYMRMGGKDRPSNPVSIWRKQYMRQVRSLHAPEALPGDFLPRPSSSSTTRMPQGSVLCRGILRL